MDKFQEEELDIKHSRRKSEFHCLGKRTEVAHVQSRPDFFAVPTARTFYRNHAGNLKILLLPFMKTFLNIRICMTSEKVK